MSFAWENLSPKARRMVMYGNLCLGLSGLLRLFEPPIRGLGRGWVHALIGFLLGLSLVLNLYGLSLGRKCKKEPDQAV